MHYGADVQVGSRTAFGAAFGERLRIGRSLDGYERGILRSRSFVFGALKKRGKVDKTYIKFIVCVVLHSLYFITSIPIAAHPNLSTLSAPGKLLYTSTAAEISSLFKKGSIFFTPSFRSISSKVL